MVVQILSHFQDNDCLLKHNKIKKLLYKCVQFLNLLHSEVTLNFWQRAPCIVFLKMFYYV